MAKRRSLEEKLARLRLLRGLRPSQGAVHELRDALADTSNLVAAEAAVIAGAARLDGLAPDLVAAFERFLVNPLKTDKLCRAKIAIAEGLNLLELAEEHVFWCGARHVQLEPVWGGQKDTAAPLRVACAFGLVRIRALGVMPLLVDLLGDPEKDARMGAAQALAYSETEAAGLLLRLKARLGDREPEVISECFNGVLKLMPEVGVSFVAEFLETASPAVREAAILALGESRRREAFDVLKAFRERHADVTLQETVSMAMALLRLPVATDYLLALVADGARTIAEAALSALAVHRYDARIRERTAAAVAASGRVDLQAYFEQRFRIQT
jgi:HEAT repeat protein